MLLNNNIILFTHFQILSILQGLYVRYILKRTIVNKKI